MSASPPIKLTTLSALKYALDEHDFSDASFDDYLRELITAISARIIDYLGRGVSEESRTTVFDIKLGQRKWFLDAYPVTSITSIKIDHQRDFANATAIDSDDYVLRSYRNAAWIELLYDEAPGVGVMQIIYTAGMGTSTAQLTSGFPEVEAACQSWIKAIIVKRKGGPQGETVSVGGGSIRKDELKMPQHVQDMLAHLRRIGGVSQ